MRGRKPKSDAIRRGISDMELAGEALGVSMPEDIAADPVQSKVWGWVAPPVNNFTEQDIPNLRLLVFWHAIAQQAQESLRLGNGTISAFDITGYKEIADRNGNRAPMFRKHPAISVLKQASAEIRALSDMLGLSPLARSRIGLMQATTVKTAAETSKMFTSIDAAYQIEAEVVPD